MSCEVGNNYYKVDKPIRDFSSFDGDDMHEWLYKCTQYFKVEEINDIKKLKLTSHYMNDWHDQKIDVFSQVQECRSNK